MGNDIISGKLPTARLDSTVLLLCPPLTTWRCKKVRGSKLFARNPEHQNLDARGSPRQLPIDAVTVAFVQPCLRSASRLCEFIKALCSKVTCEVAALLSIAVYGPNQAIPTFFVGERRCDKCAYGGGKTTK